MRRSGVIKAAKIEISMNKKDQLKQQNELAAWRAPLNCEALFRTMEFLRPI